MIQQARHRTFLLLCAMLLVLTLACFVGQRFYAASVAVPAPALAVLVDELVELHRQTLTGAGDRSAMYRPWHDLRDQFVVISVQARSRGGPLLVHVQIATNPGLAAQPAPNLYYSLTPREDDAWDIVPLPSRHTFWIL